MSSTSPPPTEHPHVETDGELRQWCPVSSDAWIGLLQTHRRLTRELDAELERHHDLSFSALEILGRLAHAPERHLRMSDLAERASLSLSRVSRLVDQLERRGATARQACPTDARVVHVTLTPDGVELLKAAQETHFAGVEERFFGPLSDEEVALLAGIFSRFVGEGRGGDCRDATPPAASEPATPA
jgi:DNA-binding MarR family transcriptional regulator